MKNKIKNFLLSFALVGALVSVPLVATPTMAAASPEDTATIFALTNQARANEGRAPLSRNSAMDAVAQAWADYMAETGDYRHNPDFTYQIPSGFVAASENVAWGFDSTDVITAWLNSPGHRDNIMYPTYTDIGIGYALNDANEPYAVQVFAEYGQVPVAPVVETFGLHESGLFLVTWTQPDAPNNSSIDEYTVTLWEQYESVAHSVDTDRVDAQTRTNYFNFYDLKPGRTYYATLYSTNYVGYSNETTSGTYSIPAIAPSAPDAPTIFTVNGNAVEVHWSVPENGGSPITRYDLTLVKVGGDSPTVVSVPGNETIYTFSGLEPGESWSVYVTAFNVVGASPDSPSSNVVDTPVREPDQPHSVNAFLNGETSIEILWSAPEEDGGTPITSYQVVLYDEKLDESEVVKTVDGDVTETTVTNLTPGGRYRVAIIAVNNIGSSDPSLYSQTVEIPATNPSAPKNVVAALSDINQITVTWDVPDFDGGADLQNYYVVLTPTSGEGSIILSEVVTASDFSIMFDVHENTTYVATVRSYNNAGLFSITVGSSAPVVVPKAPTAPDAPVLTVDNTTSDSITVSWDEPYNGGSAIVLYWVFIEDENGEPIYDEQVTEDTFTITFSTLDYATNYRVSILAGNWVGLSEVGVLDVTTDAIAPLAPANPSAAATSGTSVLVTWLTPDFNGGKSITEYQVDVYNSNDELVVSQTTDALSIEITGLERGTIYSFAITAKNEDATSVPATAVATTWNVPTLIGSPVATQLSGDSVEVTWFTALDNGSLVTEHIITAVPTSGTPTVITSNSGITSVIFDNLLPNVTYTFEVVAANAVGNSTPAVSNPITTPIRVSSEPRNVVLTKTGNNSATVTWDAPSNLGGGSILSYIVTLVDSEDNETSYNVAGNVRTYTFTELDGPETYHVYVEATNEAGTSERSTASNVIQTAPTMTPDYPESDDLLPGEGENGVSVTLVNNELVVTVPGAAEGDWVYGVAYSTPTPLGWTQVRADGTAVWSLAAANLPAGQHKIAVYGVNGLLVGWATFTLTANSGSSNAGTANDSLAQTGQALQPYALSVAFLLIVGTALIVTGRRRAEYKAATVATK